jgi:uncharacterized protein (UPF0332 family)
VSVSSEQPPGEAAVESELEQARQARSDAEGALDAGLSDTAVINRCYYACFHAAQAVLYDRGFDPQSHSGVLSLFGSEVVTEGDATRAQGRFLNEVSEFRRQADYGSGPLDVSVSELVTDTQSFVSAMAALIEDGK